MKPVSKGVSELIRNKSDRNGHFPFAIGESEDEEKMNLAYEAVDRHAETGAADRAALYIVGGKKKVTMTFGRLRALSNQAGNLLRRLGVGRGDKVAIVLPKSPEFYVILLGAIKIGAVACPYRDSASEDELFCFLRQQTYKLVVTNASGCEKWLKTFSNQKFLLVGENVQEREHVFDYMSRIKKEDEQLDVARLDKKAYFLSHSSFAPHPRTYCYSHRSLAVHRRVGKELFGLQEDDVYWCTAHPTTVSGTSLGLWAPWLNGAATVVHCGTFSAERSYETIEKLQVTVWNTSAVAYRMLRGAGDWRRKSYDLSSLRRLLCFTGAVEKDLNDWSKTAFSCQIEGHWLSAATGTAIFGHNLNSQRPGALGIPLFTMKAAVVDADGREQKDGEIGYLALQKDFPARGWREEEEGEWLITDTKAYKDQDGYFWPAPDNAVFLPQNRAKEAAFIEKKLISHPAVRQVGALPVPGPEEQTNFHVYVVPEKGTEKKKNLKEELMEHVQKKMPHSVRVKKIVFCEQLPQKQSGKLMRGRLAEVNEKNPAT